MSRWQIASIVLYSHDDRKVVVEFDLSSVNIIVGVSYTGKSAIVDIIDYCLGASECHIPGIVRESTSWVAVLWRKGQSEVFMGRRVPQPHHLSSREMYFAMGAPVEVPQRASSITPNTNRDGALRQFEAVLTIGHVKGETFTEREGTRISLRHVVPYVLQSDDVIINKTTLFRGANDERRLSITDSLPYFLGAVDEESAKAEILLRRYRQKRERELRKAEAARRKLEDERQRSLDLLSEAAQLGMVDSVADDAPAEEMLEMLRHVAAWNPNPMPVVDGDGHLSDLYAQELELRQRYTELRRRLEAARVALGSASDFAGTLERQKARLSVTGYFKKDVERELCPVCEGPIRERTVSLRKIEDALERVENELSVMQRGRPQIDGYVAVLEEALAATGEALGRVRSRIAAVVRESEGATNGLGDDERRVRVAGRVSYFLDERGEDRESVDSSRIDVLDEEISRLEEIADPVLKAERLEAIQIEVSSDATEILKKLPFDAKYRDSRVVFSARRLNIQFVRGSQVMRMQAMGGDESYLSGHVATLLALHRVFADGGRPVPGVLVFDQLSRPFFPADDSGMHAEIEDKDREDLKKYFDVLFDEVEEQQSLQVIVLEHALFEDDARYMAAVKKRWTTESKLIPNDWPRAGKP